MAVDKTSMISVREEDKKYLQLLSAEKHVTMLSVIHDLVKEVKEHRRKKFFQELRSGFAALKNNPDQWAEELKERALFDNTLADGRQID